MTQTVLNTAVINTIDETRSPLESASLPRALNLYEHGQQLSLDDWRSSQKKGEDYLAADLKLYLPPDTAPHRDLLKRTK